LRDPVGIRQLYLRIGVRDRLPANLLLTIVGRLSGIAPYKRPSPTRAHRTIHGSPPDRENSNDDKVRFLFKVAIGLAAQRRTSPIRLRQSAAAFPPWRARQGTFVDCPDRCGRLQTAGPKGSLIDSLLLRASQNSSRRRQSVTSFVGPLPPCVISGSDSDPTIHCKTWKSGDS
jgi:hypothetical protein